MLVCGYDGHTTRALIVAGKEIAYRNHNINGRHCAHYSAKMIHRKIALDNDPRLYFSDCHVHAEARCHLRDQPHQHRHAFYEHATFGDEACSGETDPEAKALLAEFTLTPSSRVYQHHRPEVVPDPSTSGSGERRGNRLILPQSV